MFYAYRPKRKSPECWITQEAYQKVLETKRNAHKKKYISVAGTNHQTGSELGAYHLGQEHPSHEGIFFMKYRPERKSNEYWVTEEKMKEILANTRERNAIRCSRTARSCLPEEEVKYIKMIYRIRDIKNEAHGGTVYHVDHIMPIAKGGLHHSSNLQLATAKWNLSKGVKIL